MQRDLKQYLGALGSDWRPQAAAVSSLSRSTSSSNLAWVAFLWVSFRYFFQRADRPYTCNDTLLSAPAASDSMAKESDFPNQRISCSMCMAGWSCCAVQQLQHAHLSVPDVRQKWLYEQTI